jgi:murein endopeptidase
VGWRRGEVWLDAELWVPEPAVAGGFEVPSFASDAPPGLAASRHRRAVREGERRARRSRTSAIALSPAVVFALAALNADGRIRGGALAEDPPSLTFRFDNGVLKSLEQTPHTPKHVQHREAARAPAVAEPRIAWHHATSVGLPYGGRLVHGTQLPVQGPDWVTWDPITDSVPNLPHRLYGNERTIRTIVAVTHAYRAAHPHAPRVVIGDISWIHGGRLDDHVSHQNGLDVDVYFPRRDRELRAPTSTSQIDHRLAQDLLTRFVHAGAQMIFIAPGSGFRGPSEVVMPWPGHEYHMHVRFPPPGV